MRNDVPGGAEGLLVPPAGVARAGGTPGRVLIEQLRASIRALEQVPVSLGLPPAPGTGPSRPACSLSSSPSNLFTPPAWAGSMPRPPPDRGTSRLLTLRRELLHPRLSGHYEERDEAISPRQARAGRAARDQAAPPTTISLPLSPLPLPRLAQGVASRGAAISCSGASPKRVAREWGHPYGPGLIALGLDPARLLIVETRTMQDAAWALEEGLKSLTLVAALGQAEISGRACRPPPRPCRASLAHALSPPLRSHAGSRRTGLPGTLTRWCIAARGGAGSPPFDAAAPGAPAWHVTFERCRGEAPGRSFIVEFSHELDGFHLSAASSARAAEEKRQSSCRMTDRSPWSAARSAVSF